MELMDLRAQGQNTGGSSPSCPTKSAPVDTDMISHKPYT